MEIISTVSLKKMPFTKIIYFFANENKLFSTNSVKKAIFAAEK